MLSLKQNARGLDNMIDNTFLRTYILSVGTKLFWIDLCYGHDQNCSTQNRNMFDTHILKVYLE